MLSKLLSSNPHSLAKKSTSVVRWIFFFPSTGPRLNVWRTTVGTPPVAVLGADGFGGGAVWVGSLVPGCESPVGGGDNAAAGATRVCGADGPEDAEASSAIVLYRCPRSRVDTRSYLCLSRI